MTEEQNLDNEMKFPTDIPFLSTIPVARSKRRNRDSHLSPESEEDECVNGT